MAFWDDIQKKLSDAAAFTVQKTGELTDVAKLKYKVKVTESKLEKCYAEIGKLIYDAKKNGVDHEFEVTTLIMQADKMKDDLDTLSTELAKIRNTDVCESCGAEVSKECTFCPVCGAKFGCDCDEDCDCDADEE